jgi:sulfite reductase (NADPH) flavoprotein alpha-component
MVRQLLFQIHWLLGITAGAVLSVVGVSGALLSFEPQILRALNPGVMTVNVHDAQPLPPAELLARVHAAAPGKRVVALTLSADPDTAARVRFAPASMAGAKRTRGTTRYVDPYTGEMLGTPRGEIFFRQGRFSVMRIHRWLAAGDVGKYIVGAATLALIYFCLSGLYLRWPRRPLDWRPWFKLDWRHRGRAFLWNLHAVAGAWVLIAYLLMALTGLWWSYGWYRDGVAALTGVTQTQPPKRGVAAHGVRAPAAEAPDLDALWTVFRRQAGNWRNATLTIPAAGQPLRIRYLPTNARHERATDEMTLAPDGRVLKLERYADKRPGQKLWSSIFPLHSGSFFGLPGLICYMVASLAMPLFFVTGWLLYLDRRRKKREARAAARALSPAACGATPTLVAFTSQAGFAERLAWQTAGALQAVGVPVAVHALGALGDGQLKTFSRALFVVSTFGDGEPPDGARAFARCLMERSLPLSGFHFGLLSLGDSKFAHFCGFGRGLDQWLRQQGAQPLFSPVEVDDGDPAAIESWQAQLTQITGKALNPAWREAPYGRWRLVERRLLNPGSVGEGTYHLELEAAAAGVMQWRAGDIAEVRPRHPRRCVAAFLAAHQLVGEALVNVDGSVMTLAAALARSILPQQVTPREAPQALVQRLQPLPKREYSIASLPQQGRLWLLVRRQRQADGSLTLGSGWLTEQAAAGADIELRLRSNPAFHAPGDARPLILIGNGTGLAGLRAHLHAQILAGGRAWLIFGERQAARDFYYRDEIEQWRQQGVLERLDLAFSRDQARRIHVQDRVTAAAGDVRSWIADGAAIYICGSIDGMAPGVETVLTDILGTGAMERLVMAGRYRRDVY